MKTAILLKPNWNILCFIGFLAAALFLCFYVYSINELTKGVYFINSYGKQINSLLQKNRNLEVDFAESGFLGNLEIKTKELSFEKTKETKYIQILDNSFVVVK
ncbi:MAG: hypothetical protein CEN87_327 [Parcubacteria group bacterium Licking1014_1]|nr:MAG: hypothetical protein CEN87_327 [Parcubacteria group bacterium Licking1014_1]